MSEFSEEVKSGNVKFFFAIKTKMSVIIQNIYGMFKSITIGENQVDIIDEFTKLIPGLDSHKLLQVCIANYKNYMEQETKGIKKNLM